MPEATLKNPHAGGTAYRDKIPYCYATCDGCLSDRDNHALKPDECQAHVSRPLNDSAGPCPYHSSEPSECFYGKKVKQLDFDNDSFPKVSSRFAEIVVRGINEGNMAYWQRHNFAWEYELPGELAYGEFRGWDLMKYPNDDGFVINVFHKGIVHERNRYFHETYRGRVGHAKIDKGVLKLYRNEGSTGFMDSVVCIEIVDPAERQEVPDEKERSKANAQRDLLSWGESI